MHLINMAVLWMTYCLLMPWNDFAIHGIAFFPATATATQLHLAAGCCDIDSLVEVAFENRANTRDMSKRQRTWLRHTHRYECIIIINYYYYYYYYIIFVIIIITTIIIIIITTYYYYIIIVHDIIYRFSKFWMIFVWQAWHLFWIPRPSLNAFLVLHEISRTTLAFCSIKRQRYKQKTIYCMTYAIYNIIFSILQPTLRSVVI